MGVFELVLLLIAAVLVSTLLSQVSSKVSTPLVQIGIGVLIALFVQVPVQVTLDPEIFLVLFIAPLLFNEAKNIDRLGFWQNKGMIVSLALGLVVATTLGVGFSMSAIMPTLPLAAAFALGAALGPTDAVAVSSMSGVAKFSPKQKSILAGESLINDASGLVAFQFAIALAVTGEFSLAEAGLDFAKEFFGGLALGVVLGWACNLFVAFVRSLGLDNRRFHVLFELLLPFAAYMLGDFIHVSGVLTVVACGVVFSISYKQAGIGTSKMNIVSSSVWDVLSFALNGIVFVLLGMMLPGGMIEQLDDVTAINWKLVGCAFALTAIVIALRFLWVLLVERIFGSAEEINKGLAKFAAVISFAGAKGAVTLSIILTIPATIAARSDMIFMASIAILTTLTIANFALPILAPADKIEEDETRKKEQKAYARVLRQVIERLSEESESAEYIEKLAYQAVISEYTERVDHLNDMRGVQDDESFVELRLEALHWQVEKAQSMKVESLISAETADSYVETCRRRAERLKKHSSLTWNVGQAGRKFKTAMRAFLKSIGLATTPKNEESAEMKELKVECHRYVVDKLSALSTAEDPNLKAEDVAALLVEYQKKLGDAKATAPSVTQFIKGADMADSIRMRALRYEQEFIGEAYSDEMIDRVSANRLRRQVAAMQLDVADEI